MKYKRAIIFVACVLALTLCAYRIGFIRGMLSQQAKESVGAVKLGLVKHRLLQDRRYDRLEGAIRVELRAGVYGYQEVRKSMLGCGLTDGYEKSDFASEIKEANQVTSVKN
jgi:hypothetical protein